MSSRPVGRLSNARVRRANLGPVSLRIPQEVRAAIQETAKRSGRGFSSVANEMLTEAVKIRRIPGTTFTDSPSGRVACVAGTGIKVFLLVRAYRTMHENWERLRKAYDWLSERQLRAALAYSDAYPAEIEARIQADEYWTPERVWSTYPFLKPPWR